MRHPMPQESPTNAVSCPQAERRSSRVIGERIIRAPSSCLLWFPFLTLTSLAACGSIPMDAPPASCPADEAQLYARNVHGAITRNWVLPRFDVEIVCTVLIRQNLDGAIEGFEFADCNDDATLRRSVGAAVRRSSPLPLPANMACFDHDVRLIFQYNPATRE